MFVRTSSKLKRADVALVRQHNERLVLRAIWDAVTISRADLSRQTGLARSTVSDIVQTLLQSGLLVESRMPSSGVGRPPIALRFDETRFCIVGVEMGASHLAVAVTNLRGGVIAHHWVALPVESRPDLTVPRLVEEIAGTLEDAGCSVRDLVGIGIAVPCPLDSSTPNRLSARILPAWADVDLLGAITAEFDVPILMENDANAGALTELWWGPDLDVPDITYVKVATGVGAGHIIGGSLYRGSSGIAGEIGHTAIVEHGPQCRCGLYGCLEAMVGAGYLEDRAAIRSADESSLPRDAKLVDIVAAAQDGDAFSTKIIGEAGHYLGIAVANLFNLLNPSVIVLGGPITRAGDLLLEPLESAVRERALVTALDRDEVRITEFGELAIATGAATLVLDAALADPSLFPTTGDARRQAHRA
jgi:predicted NBD/HSP70 family sugar kinase